MEFDAQFESAVLSQCMVDSKFLIEANRVLSRRAFAIPEHGWVWGVITDTWSRSSELPTLEIFSSNAVLKFEKKAERESHLEIAKKLIENSKSVESPKATLEGLTGWVRALKIQEATIESLERQKRGEWDKAWEPIKQAVRDDIPRGDYEVGNWIEQWDERMAERKHRRDNPHLYRTILTGFPSIDHRIGGVQEGELAAIMATTNMGKSILSVNIGYAAVARSRGVIHISTEMSKRKVLQRYDSRFSRTSYRKFKRYEFSDEELAKLEMVRDRYRKKFEGLLRVVATPNRALDIDMIRRIMDELKPGMSRFDMLIVDCADHIQARGRYEKQYLADSANFWDLKCLAEEYSLPIWVTMQAKQEFESKLGTTRAAAGAYDKSRICDLVVSINERIESKQKTKIVIEGEKKDVSIGDEKENRKNSEYFLYVAKSRDDEKGFEIDLDVDFSVMSIKERKKEVELDGDDGSR